MPAVPTSAVVGTTIAFSFILLGNAITQSFMGVPALLVDFPRKSTSSPEAYSHAARHLGRQWPVFWNMGNVFFRPISTLGIFGYAYAAYTTYAAASATSPPILLRDFGTTDSGLAGVGGSWRLYAVSAACHLATVIHSAVNMQPLNERIDGLKDPEKSGVDEGLAEFWARKWIRLNMVRIFMPAVAGSMALYGVLRHGAH